MWAKIQDFSLLAGSSIYQHQNDRDLTLMKLWLAFTSGPIAKSEVSLMSKGGSKVKKQVTSQKLALGYKVDLM